MSHLRDTWIEIRRLDRILFYTQLWKKAVSARFGVLTH